jgi:hypothetical protein
LFEATVEVQRAIQPLHVTPEMLVFVNANGHPIEPNSMLPHWFRCPARLRDPRARAVLDQGHLRDDGAARRCAQGVARGSDGGERHYSEWMPSDDRSDLDRFLEFAPEFFAVEPRKFPPRNRRLGDNLQISQ